MNRAMRAARLGHPLHSRFSRKFTAPPPPTTHSLLSDPQLQDDLTSHSATPTTSLLPSHPLRLQLLSRLSVLTGRPIASDAFLKLDNAEAMAEWYAKNVRGQEVREHGRNVMRSVLGAHVVNELEDGEKVDDKKAQMVRQLPSNLALDSRTTEKQKIGKVRTKDGDFDPGEAVSAALIQCALAGIRVDVDGTLVFLATHPSPEIHSVH